MDIRSLKSRVEVLLAQASVSGGNRWELTNETLQGTIAVLAALHGPESEQAKSLQRIAEITIYNRGPAVGHLVDAMLQAVAGTLRNIKAELDADFIGSLQKRIAGDVLSDFIHLAKTALDQDGDNAKNVAAVLAAAAYEDAIRRMGASFAGAIGRDPLNNVIDQLKNAGILVAPQLGIALSYLSFRNHALHADWDKIDRAAVHSVLGFVEQLLLKHFA